MKFDAKKVTNEIIEFIRNYYKNNSLKGAVIGISGGKDSGVVAGLFAKALGRQNVVGLWMPCHSKDEDKKNAYLVAEKFDFEMIDHDLTMIYDQYVENVKEKNLVNDDNLTNANINIKPRLRMMTLYYYAAMLSSQRNGVYIVPGTSNKCELYVGYFTKGGDNVSDIKVLADLTVDEVIQIGEYIGVPDKVIHKVPDDGLSGKTDEEKLGVKYSEITSIIKNPNTNKVDNEIKNKIIKLHNQNRHKFDIPTYNKKQRLGIYMGSFNPVHKGHIDVVNYLLDNDYVDKVLIVPTLGYWDKIDLLNIEDRINMLKFFENDKVKIDTEHNEYIYTYELVKELEKVYDSELYLIMGADNIINFSKWKNYQELLKYKIIVMNRDNIDVNKYLKEYDKHNFIVLSDYKFIDISSRELRKDINSKYLDPRVLGYIEKNNLFKE